MKELTKSIFVWFVSLFNVGIYNFKSSDNIDSLILSLRRNGIEHQANELLRLYEMIEYQQEVLVFLDVFKCLFMLISLLFLFILNQARLCAFFLKAHAKFKRCYQFIKNKFKPV